MPITVKLPELKTRQLKTLNSGDTFMLARSSHDYSPQTRVYMVLEDRRYTDLVPSVCLNTGELTSWNKSTKVVKLKVAMECTYWTPDDDNDGLPF